MATNLTGSNNLYGVGQAVFDVQKNAFIARRNPTTDDKASLGQMWINEANNTYYVLTSNASGSAIWTAQTANGGTQASITLNGGSGTVLTVSAGGNTSLGGTLSVSGTSTLTGAVLAPAGVSVTTAGHGVALPGGVLLLAGSGSPSGSVTAPKGSFFLRTDGSSVSTRAYINTNSGTAWTAVTTAS